MSDNTEIEWTDATWNPITGCTLVSEGCRNCYAAKLAATRMKHHPSRKGLARRNAAGEAKFTGEVRFNEQWLDQPLRWRKPRMIFVCAHGDLFHEAVPDEWIDRVFAVMALAPQHTFQVLTKRPERAQKYIYVGGGSCINIGIRQAIEAMGHPDIGAVDKAFPNVWLGTSVEDQATADARIPHLLATPAAVRFVSAEPLLGPVDLTEIWARMPGGGESLWNALDKREAHDAALEGDVSGSIDWVIVGGESGPKARPMHPDWARSLRDQCLAAGVAFFFKQWGEWLPFGQSGFTAWHAHTSRNGNLRRPQGKWWGHADFNDGAGGPNTHTLGPVETMMIDDHSTQAVRIGKRAAGRLLDGREWNEMPRRA